MANYLRLSKARSAIVLSIFGAVRLGVTACSQEPLPTATDYTGPGADRITIELLLDHRSGMVQCTPKIRRTAR